MVLGKVNCIFDFDSLFLCYPSSVQHRSEKKIFLNVDTYA